MKGLILKSYDYFSKNRLVLWLVLFLSFGLMAALAYRISFEEDISKMLQMDNKTREYRKLIQNTRLVDKLVICISDNSPVEIPQELKMAYCDSLVVRLNAIDSSLVRKITHRPDDFPYTDVYEALLRNLPFFMEEKDYAYFDTLFQAENMQNQLNLKLKQLSSLTGIMIRRTLPLDPVGISNPVTLRLQKLGEATGYEIINGYFFTKDRKNLVFFIEPANPANETGKNTRLIKAIEKYSGELGSKKAFSGIECNYFGATAMSVENARQIQRDTVLTIAVMCFVLILLITSVFRRKRTPVIIFLPVIFGLLFALACISLIEKNISLIAIGATSVLLGFAVNYPIHILTHRLHEKNLRKVIGDLVEPMTIGSATTIGGFICLLFVKAEILHDFGLLGAFGLIGAVIFSLIFLPHLLGSEQPIETNRGKWLEKAANLKIDSNSYILWSVILLTPVLLYYSQFIQFDSDLMHLNYVSPRLEKTEKILRGTESKKHPVYVISFGSDLNNALRSAGNIKHLSDSLNLAGIPNKYTGISSFLISEQEQKIRLEHWRNYFTKEKTEKIQADLNKAGRNSGFKEHAFDKFYSVLNFNADHIDSLDFQLLKDVFAKETVTVSPEMTTIVSVLQIPVESRSKIEKILSDVPGARMLDNKFLSSQLASIITDDFNFIALFSAILVFVALLLTYGRIELALTAFLPMVVSWIWILGLMGLFNIQFNIVNIILSTFIFGLGDDYCIFTMDGLLQGYRNKTKQLPVIRMGILLSGLTAFIGFGVMLIARHPALQSIALVSVIGITSVLVISQVLMPWLFRIFIISPAGKGLPPIRLITIIKTITIISIAFLLYLFLCIAGFFLIIINPFRNKSSRKYFNDLISLAARILVFFIKRKIEFRKKLFPVLPETGILVTNHGSITDIMLTLSLYPGIIIYSDNKIWNSFLFGYLARIAGHCYLDETTVIDLEIIKQRIKEGYIVAIMSHSGSESESKNHSLLTKITDLSIKLNMDLIPVIVTGTEKYPGEETLVVSGSNIIIEVLEPGKFDQGNEEKNGFRNAGNLNELFKNETLFLENEQRTPEFCRQRLINNYIFKGPGLEYSLKAGLKSEDDYQAINNVVPDKGEIMVASNDYGFLAYMLAYYKSGRTVTGIEFDKEKANIAANGYDRPRNLTFTAPSDHKGSISRIDCVILNDITNIEHFQVTQDLLTGLGSRLMPDGCIIVYKKNYVNQNRNPLARLATFFINYFFNQINSKESFHSTDNLYSMIQNAGFELSSDSLSSGETSGITVFKRAGK